MGNLSIQEVRARLLLSRPYYASAAMNLKFIEAAIGTLGVDKHWRCYYDPAALAKWSNSECAAVLEHELNHLLRDHAGRQSGRDHQKWNIAADCEINDDLQGLPTVAMFPSKFGLPDGQTAEEYFDTLPTPPQGQGQGQEDCGSGCGGERRPHEQGSPSPAGSDGQEGASGATPGVSQIEGDAIRRQTADDVRSCGTAPAGLKRWADTILTPPRIHWSKLLPAAIRRATAQGTPQGYKYPSRRTSDFILPRLVSGRPCAALVIDSSGSITDADLALAIAITKDATRHADLAIYSCDTEAKRVNRLAPGSIVGGGGTDMRQGIKVALEAKPKPHSIVIITDCYSPWDSVAPSVPVVILTANPDQAPKWAKVITVAGGQ